MIFYDPMLGPYKKDSRILTKRKGHTTKGAPTMSHESHETYFDPVSTVFYCSKCGIKMSTFESTKPCNFVPELPTKQQCECGSESVGSPRHSDWCPKYKEEK